MFSRMLCRRVPVLKLGSRGPGGDARSLRLWTQAFALVRSRSQAFAEGRTCRRDENRRETQNCRRFLRFVLQKQQSGGSWSRNPELSSLLDSSCVFASQKCQQSRGSGASWSRSPELSSLLDSSRVFASQKCQQSQASWSRSPELSSLLDSSCVFASLKSVKSVKSVNSHRDRGCRGREAQNCRLLDSSCVFASQQCQQSQGSGSWSRSPELSSLLGSSCVFASQKCQQSRGLGGSWSRNPERFVLGLRASTVSTVTGIGGEALEGALLFEGALLCFEGALQISPTCAPRCVLKRPPPRPPRSAAPRRLNKSEQT